MKTSPKPGDFLAEPWGKGQRGAAGIPEVLGRKLEERGSDKAYVVLGWFLVLKKDEDPFREWLKAMWHQWEAVRATASGALESGATPFCDALWGAPNPYPQPESPEFAAGLGLLPHPLERKQLLSSYLPFQGLQGLQGSSLPSAFQLLGEFSFLHASAFPSPAGSRSIIISFPEWIPGPFPHLHPRLWSVLCHLASLLAEQSLSIQFLKSILKSPTMTYKRLSGVKS